MIDIHIHILPGLDDGAFCLEESLQMARMATECGVTDIIATPHCNLSDSPKPLWAEQVRRSAEAFQEALSAEKIPLRIYPGMEIYGMPDVPRLLREGKLMSLADSRYTLVEFPFYEYGEEATELLEVLVAMGYQPVVAHPERYRYVQEMPKLLNIWKDLGCLLQINRGSLLGRFGHQARRTAYEMLDRGFVSFVASDGHSSVRRTPWMDDIRRQLELEYSWDLAHKLLKSNPERIIRNQKIETEEPRWF